MRHLRNKRGFTLTEVMVSVAILAMVTTALVGLLVASLRGYGSGVGQENTTNNATIALQKLLGQVRDGKSVQISNGKLLVTYPKVVVNTSTGEKVYDNTGTGSVISYFVQNGILVSQEGTGPVKTIARGVYSATFTLDFTSANALDITLECREKSTGRLCSQTVSGRVALRNYR